MINSDSVGLFFSNILLRFASLGVLAALTHSAIYLLSPKILDTLNQVSNLIGFHLYLCILHGPKILDISWPWDIKRKQNKNKVFHFNSAFIRTKCIMGLYESEYVSHASRVWCYRHIVCNTNINFPYTELLGVYITFRIKSDTITTNYDSIWLTRYISYW